MLALAVAAFLIPSSPQSQDVAAAIDALCARSGGLATAASIGVTRLGTGLTVIALAAGDTPPPAERPAVLVVAGVHGRHRLSTELAMHHANALVDGYASDARTVDLLDHTTVYIVPQLNPDGAALGRTGNARPLDLDRDGTTDEDPVNDLDGDGVIAQMRWPDPEGEWIVDPDAPTTLRRADRSKGERGVYRLGGEGRDDDGDGERDEDPGEGVLLHRGFAHDFALHDRATGGLPCGEPEARALADFVFGHRNLAFAFVYDVADNLLGEPKTDAAKDRKPLHGIHAGDAALYAAVGARYREVTGRTGTVRDVHDGSPWSWLYSHAGIPAFATDVWRLPEPVKDKDGKTPSADALRAAHAEKLGRGYVAWHPVEHPELADVEVGGFVAAIDSELLPDDARARVLQCHHDWFLGICGWRPSCRIAKFEAKPLRDGVFAIEAVIANDGRLAVLSAIGEHSRRFPPPRLVLDPGGGQIVAGTAHVRTANLAGLGGSERVRWIVAAPAGSVVRLTLHTDFAGNDAAAVTL